jgi:hypothetical protein
MIIKSEGAMLVEAVMGALMFIVGFSVHAGLSRVRLIKAKTSSKDEIDILLDEIEQCGEVESVEIVNYRTQLKMKSGVIIRSGKRCDSGGWYDEPMLYISNVSIDLTGKQKNRVHSLVNYKHAESGREQITERLLTE